MRNRCVNTSPSAALAYSWANRRESRQIVRVEGRFEKPIAHIQELELRVTQHPPAALVHILIAFLMEVIDKQDSGHRLRNLLKKAVAFFMQLFACLCASSEQQRLRRARSEQMELSGVKRHNKRLKKQAPFAGLKEKRHGGRLGGIRCVRSTARATLSAASTGSPADSFSLACSFKSAVSSAARASPHANALAPMCADLLGGLGGGNPTPVLVGRNTGCELARPACLRSSGAAARHKHSRASAA